MTAIEKLEEFKKEFDKRLLAFLDKKEKEAEKLASSYGSLIKEIKRFVESGGKRLRPAFVFYSYKATGGKNNQEVWSVCLALELIHMFALIHDDIMDCSEFRRGKQTTWKLLRINQAILAGDLAFALAEELMSEFVMANFSLRHRRMNSANTKKVLHYFNLLKFEVIGGQFLDISNGTMGQWDNEAMVMKIMELKTGRYTIARPLQIGAAIVGADEKILKKLFKYGVNLGIAFQIQDDILGTFGDEKVIGKPVGSDLKEGKKTLLVVKLMEELSNCQIVKLSEKFNRVFGNKNLTKADLEWVKKLMVKLQVLDYCQKKAVRLIGQAKKALQKIELDSEAKEFLLGIADYIIERRK